MLWKAIGTGFAEHLFYDGRYIKCSLGDHALSSFSANL